ncbi:hypothetical protein A988_14783 [Pseudomonas syringae BRIP39023]|nr:hypothetical protein A988_14783 [Pseudomonas syringae BRIP39023]KEZ26405.1 hypothetical protein A3SK_0116400 [Pseudomonas amygdali pv. tabaci str. 6605]BCS44469.1 hypothetical protein Pta6605_28000 [Pseudomonas amygdali pv. tabaci]
MKSNVYPINTFTPPLAELAMPADVPVEVRQAMEYDWEVFVDAFLVNGARVGDRYAATAYFGQQGKIPDGMTVATHSVRHVTTKGTFKLLQTLDGADHYVLVSEHSVGDIDGNDA